MKDLPREQTRITSGLVDGHLSTIGSPLRCWSYLRPQECVFLLNHGRRNGGDGARATEACIVSAAYRICDSTEFSIFGNRGRARFPDFITPWIEEWKMKPVYRKLRQSRSIHEAG
jgi:hypothetical protein